MDNESVLNFRGGGEAVTKRVVRMLSLVEMGSETLLIAADHSGGINLCRIARREEK